MGGSPLIVALEGASDSGKTTLARHLSTVQDWQPVLVLPCYADQADAATLPPAVERDERAQIGALSVYVELDRARWAAIGGACDPRLIVIDRSWLSLLAHVYAVERAGGPAAYHAARRLLFSAGGLVQPNLVLVLHASAQSRLARQEKGDAAAWFTDPGFNSHVAKFFLDEAPASKLTITHLDADLPATEIAKHAESAIRRAASVL